MWRIGDVVLHAGDVMLHGGALKATGMAAVHGHWIQNRVRIRLVSRKPLDRSWRLMLVVG